MAAMERKRQKKIVLFLRTGLSVTDRRLYDGVYEYGNEHEWQIQSVNVPSIIDCAVSSSVRADRKWLLDLLAFWKPDGCITMWDAPATFHNHANFGRVPVVYCDAIPESMPAGANVVSIDSNAIANCAAKELLKLGLESFAYVSYPSHVAWCEAREKCFREIIELNGKSFSSARLPERKSSAAKKRAFAHWLSSIPKPVGLFAANDDVAEAVIDMCVRNGLSIPYDVAVVGADNDELVCENAAVPITSIIPDFRNAGKMAAQLLDELMVSPGVSQIRHFGIGGIVMRESTRRASAYDGRIIKSLEYIRHHACEGIGVPDVVKVMGCSRSYADIRFAKVVGWSILQEIRRVKVDKVKDHLRSTKKPLGVIADKCGFASCDDMRRTFRQFEGSSLSAWRQKAEGSVSL